MAVFWLIRGVFLGTLTGQVDATDWHLFDNFKRHVDDLYAFTLQWGVLPTIWLIFAALISCLLIIYRELSGFLLIVMAAVLLLPYSTVTGTGGRFFYMLQAPLCVVAVIPALAFRGALRNLLIASTLVALIPTSYAFAVTEAGKTTAAGLEVRQMISAIHDAIPANDGVPNVIDGVPELFDGRLMMGDFFEIGVQDSYHVTAAPFVVRTRTVLAFPVEFADILNVQTHFWRYDLASKRVIRINFATWLAAHPEMAPKAAH
jgi:hypothetical protein